MRALIVLAALALAAVSCDRAQITTLCPSVASTGGDPTGDWEITASCQVPYGRTTVDDWCSRLVYNEQGVVDGLFLGTEFLPLKSGLIKYQPDPDAKCGQGCGFYSAQFTFEGVTTTHFPRGCLSQHIAPADGGCMDLEQKLRNLIDMSVLPTISRNPNELLTCADEPDGSGGCACTYTVSTASLAADVGSWRMENNLLIHYPSAPATNVASMADIAIGSDGTSTTMLMHGHEGTPLLAHDPLRYLALRKK
jgi:hypothetical protein